MNGILKEDYEEPACLLDMRRGVRETIPARRVLDRLDSLLDGGDYTAAERHLRYWLSEAERIGDERGKLTVLNELIGLCRKMKNESEGASAVREALALAASADIKNTITHGTTLINAATFRNAFGDAAGAVPLYREAQRIYEAGLPENDGRLGGLYNNMALALAELRDFDEAEALFHRAIAVMSAQEQGEAETAITYLNLADLAAARYGIEAAEQEIYSLLDTAEQLLDSEKLVRNAYYAFVCEKCAPVFSCYGYFLAAGKLRERARAIHERA